MDETTSTPPASGGTLEPAHQAPAAEQPNGKSKDLNERRYELRDPFAEATYRSTNFEEMVARADRLHAIRFVAIEPDGTRTRIEKGRDGWPRTANREVSPAHETSAPPTARQPTVVVETTAVDPSAERASRVAALEAALTERYVVTRSSMKIEGLGVGQSEYRYRGDTGRVAFVESASRLSTESNNPSVARSMIDVAEARGWGSLRVSGHDDFRRHVWLEATIRGVKAVGYEPLPPDLELAQKMRDSRHQNRIEPGVAATDGGGAGKQGNRGGGRKAVLVALEAVLTAKRVTQKQRTAIMAAAERTLARREAAGERIQVKVYDRAAPPVSRQVAALERQRQADRPDLAR